MWVIPELVYGLPNTLSRQLMTPKLSFSSIYAFIALWFTFGGSLCPNLWTCFSEAHTDKANDKTLFDSMPHNKPQPNFLHHVILFKRNVSYYSSEWYQQSQCIHWWYNVESLGINENVNRINDAIHLTTDTLACPTKSSHPIARKDIISSKKLIATGQRSTFRSKTFLGWIMNTGLLRIFIPI